MPWLSQSTVDRLIDARDAEQRAFQRQVKADVRGIEAAQATLTEKLDEIRAILDDRIKEARREVERTEARVVQRVEVAEQRHAVRRDELEQLRQHIKAGEKRMELLDAHLSELRLRARLGYVDTGGDLESEYIDDRPEPTEGDLDEFENNLDYLLASGDPFAETSVEDLEDAEPATHSAPAGDVAEGG